MRIPRKQVEPTAATAPDDDDADQWMTTTEASARYGISATSILQWPRLKTFPENARSPWRPGQQALWHRGRVDAWLRSRPSYRKQRPCVWWDVVSHPGYSEAAE